MTGLIVVIVVIVILYFWKFNRDKEKMINETLGDGNIATKYFYLIQSLLAVPNGRIVKESKQSLNIVGSDGINRIEFFVFQNFGVLEVKWAEQNHLGTYRKSWKFQNKYPQENMVQEIANYLQWHQNNFIKAFLGVADKEFVSSEQKKEVLVKTHQEYTQSARKKMELGDNHGAMEDFSKAVEINPNDYKAIFALGILNFWQTDSNESCIKFFTRVIEIKPDHAEAYYQRGCAKHFFQYDGAIEDFNTAIRLKPDYVEAYKFRASLKDSKGAIEDYTKIIEIEPNKENGYKLRGEARLNVKDYKGANEDYNKVLKITPNDATAWFKLAEIGRSTFYAQFKYTAIEYYSKAIAIDPHYAEAYDGRGEVKCYNLKDYNSALEDFTKAIENNPRFREAIEHRIFVKKELGDYAGAILDYNKLIEINPYDFEAYFYMGKVGIELKDFNVALKSFNKAIEYNKNPAILAEMYSLRAGTKKNLNDLDGALADYTKAIKIDTKARNYSSRYAKDYFERGIVKQKLQDIEGACLDWKNAAKWGYEPAEEYMLGTLAKAIKITESLKSDEDFIKSGRNLVESKDYQGSLVHFTKAIEINPHCAEAYYERAIVKGVLKDGKGQLVEFKKAIEINPKFTKALFSRAENYKLTGDYGEAIEDWKKIIEIEPKNFKPHYFIAKCYFSISSSTKSLMYLDKAIELSPDIPEVYKLRGLARESLGDLDGALADYSKAVELKPALKKYDYQEVLFRRGVVKHKLEDKAGAHSDLQAAINMGSEEAKEYFDKYCGSSTS